MSRVLLFLFLFVLTLARDQSTVTPRAFCFMVVVGMLFRGVVGGILVLFKKYFLCFSFRCSLFCHNSVIGNTRIVMDVLQKMVWKHYVAERNGSA